MILCHKDAGLLAARDDENTAGLLGCGCISGWVRGFEPDLTRAQALEVQIKRQQERIDLYIAQGRSDWEIDNVRKRKADLETLAAKEVASS